MGEEKRVLIAQKKNFEEKMTIKVRKRVKNGYSPNDYLQVINPNDFRSLSLLFEDLDLLGAPVEKAFREYKDKKHKNPFF